MLVDIAPHEKDAMYQMVLAVRAIAQTLKGDEMQIGRLKNWAQMLEDVVDRLDSLDDRSRTGAR